MVNEPHISQRRKSLGDSVLERNVCFVDTPGYRHGSSVSIISHAGCLKMLISYRRWSRSYPVLNMSSLI